NMSYGQVEDYAVTITNPLSINEEKFENIINIYPNPGTGTFYLQNASVLKGKSQLKVYNSVGQKVTEEALENPSDSETIDLKSLPKGIYLLRISNQDRSIIRRVVIE